MVFVVFNFLVSANFVPPPWFNCFLFGLLAWAAGGRDPHVFLFVVRAAGARLCIPLFLLLGVPTASVGGSRTAHETTTACVRDSPHVGVTHPT